MFNETTYKVANPRTQILLKEFLEQYGIESFETTTELYKAGDRLVRKGNVFITVEGELRGVESKRSPWNKSSQHYRYAFPTISVVERKAVPDNPVFSQMSFTEESDGSINCAITLFRDILTAPREPFNSARGLEDRRIIHQDKALLLHKLPGKRWEVCPLCAAEEDSPSVTEIKGFLGI